MTLPDAGYAHALHCLQAIGPLRLKKIQAVFPVFRDAWEAPAGALAEALGDNALEELLKEKTRVNPEEEWKKLLQAQIRVVAETDKEYPQLLREMPQPPALLYVRARGTGTFDAKLHTVAVIGSRKASHYGRSVARAIAGELAQAGVIVVSGLAIGIDAEAHEATLASKTPTWAVLGSGLNHIYPARNQPLARAILEAGGALLSEYHPEQEPAPFTFPQRNRVIAGLARVVLIVEAAERSGALITARYALDANREVAAVPGDIFALNSKGTNALLRRGAALVRDAGDVLELLGLSRGTETLSLDRFDEIEQHILRCLHAPITADELAITAELSPQVLNQKLSLLELRGAIQQSGGRFYRTDL